MDNALLQLAQITGQKPAVRRAKKSISNFKLRKGQGVGCVVTLRGSRMYEFYERLVRFALPSGDKVRVCRHCNEQLDKV